MSEKTSFLFKRFVDGVEMAQGICIEHKKTLEEAIKEAIRLCPKRSNTILVYDNPTVLAHTRATDPVKEKLNECLVHAAWLLEELHRPTMFVGMLPLDERVKLAQQQIQRYRDATDAYENEQQEGKV